MRKLIKSDSVAKITVKILQYNIQINYSSKNTLIEHSQQDLGCKLTVNNRLFYIGIARTAIQLGISLYVLLYGAFIACILVCYVGKNVKNSSQ